MTRPKALSPATHAVLDYGLALAFLAAPSVLGFSPTAANLAYIFGVVYLGASLLTKYPLGAVKMIPFPVHGLIESIMAAAWIVLPWVFGFAADTAARNFFVVAGVGLLAVAAVTDYQSTGSRPAFKGEERRHHLVDRRQRAMPVGRNRRHGLADRRAGRYASA